MFVPWRHSEAAGSLHMGAKKATRCVYGLTISSQVSPAARFTKRIGWMLVYMSKVLSVITYFIPVFHQLFPLYYTDISVMQRFSEKQSIN